MTDDTSADDGADTTAADSTVSLGESIGARQRPLRSRRAGLAAVGAVGLPGSLGRRSASFAGANGLSLSTRRALGMAVPDMAVDGLPVVPPAEWDESLLPPDLPRTGDATLDRIIAQQSSAATRPRSSPRRGLRSAVGRSHTPSGRNTAPGASSSRLRSTAAPMSLQPDLRQMVSGAGGGTDARPRAPRGGTGAAATRQTSAGGPRPRSGRHARGRSGRTAPWQQDPSARSTAPAESLVAGSIASAAFAPASLPRTGVEQEQQPVDTAEVVAALAGAVQGAASSTSWSLPRRTGALPPGLTAPRSPGGTPNESRTSGATARLAARVGSASPGSLPVGLDAVAGSSTVLGAPPPTDRPASRPGPREGRARAPIPAAAAFAPSEAFRSGRSTAALVAGRGGRVATATPAGSSAAGADPSLVASLRAQPPHLSLTSLPARSFDRTGVTAQGRSPVGGAAGDVPAGAARITTPDLPVAPSAVVPTSDSGGRLDGRAGGRAPAGASTGPVPRSASAAPGRRGLGSVASLLGAAVGTSRAAPARAPVGAGGPHPRATAAVADPGAAPRPMERARRTVRSLPDLASVAPTGLVAVGSSASPTRTVPTRAVPTAGTSAGSAPAAARSGGDARTSTPGRPGSTSITAGRDVGGTSPNVAPAARVGSTAAVSGRVPLATASGPGPVDAPVPATEAAAPVAPPAPIDPGERFHQTLDSHRSPRLRPLPQRFEPMARAIVARPDKVRISTDAASRKALASVGKVAATAGDVVHLARPLDASPRSAEVLAHELTHVASPSPLARFFGDDRHSHEEDRARRIGEIMARAPVGTPPASPPPAAAPPAPPPPPAPSSRSAGSNGPAGSPTPSGPNQFGPTPSSGAGRLVPTGDAGGHGQRGRGGDAGSPGQGGEVEHAAPSIDIDRLLDALEARVMRELDRRGRRWPRPI